MPDLPFLLFSQYGLCIVRQKYGIMFRFRLIKIYFRLFAGLHAYLFNSCQFVFSLDFLHLYFLPLSSLFDNKTITLRDRRVS
jgi:hypothetical protein